MDFIKGLLFVESTQKRRERRLVLRLLGSCLGVLFLLCVCAAAIGLWLWLRVG
jgi:hypothetical protein